jgi:hypothetical protein
MPKKSTIPAENPALYRAAIDYLERKAGKRYPAGRTDNGGRWYPAEAESCGCCSSVRSPSRAFPWSIFKHCFSIGHVAELYGVPAIDVRRAAKDPWILFQAACAAGPREEAVARHGMEIWDRLSMADRALLLASGDAATRMEAIRRSGGALKAA